MRETTTLYVPPDVDAAHKSWGANCGPAALAALLGVPVNDVRRLFIAFDAKRYVNPTDMQAALRAAGATYKTTPATTNGMPGRQIPTFGLAFLQFSGGWWDERPVAVQYRHTHWIAVRKYGDEILTYDVNHPDKWLEHFDWEDIVWPCLRERAEAKDVWCRTAYEVRLSET